MATKDKKQSVAHDDSGMKELARRFKANPFIFIGTFVVLIITIIAFVFVPASAPRAGAGSGALSFGSYGGVPIDFIPGNYFAQQRDYYNQQLRSSGSDENLQLAAFQVWRAAFESTVVKTAALSELKKAGFVTPPTLVDRKMAELPQFQENGRFSAARYRSMSDADRMALRSSLGEEIALNRYMEDVLSLRTSTKERDFMKAMANPERSFDYVAFPLASYPDAEVQAYISANPALFKLIHFSKITISSSEADAKKVLASIKAGTTSFEDAAKTHSKDELADKGGDMGTKLAYEFSTEITDEAARATVLDLAKGDLSSVVKVPNGWAIFRSEETSRDANAGDGNILAKARGYIASFERGRIEDYFIAEATAFVTKAQAEGMDKAATEEKLNKQSFGPLPLNFGDIELYRSITSFQKKELTGASTNENFLKEAFSTPIASYSKPLVLGDNVIVLKPTEERTAEESAVSVIDFYYPYIAGQYSERSVRNYFLQSDKLKDNFYATFIQTFMPQ